MHFSTSEIKIVLLGFTYSKVKTSEESNAASASLLALNADTPIAKA